LDERRLEAGRAAKQAYSTVQDTRRRLEAEARERISVELEPLRAEWVVAAKEARSAGLSVADICRAIGKQNRNVVYDALKEDEEW